MNAYLDEEYFHWLYGQVSSPQLKNPSRTYWHLLEILFTKEFVWFVPNDDNRVEDGRELRERFLEDLDVPEYDPRWLEDGCSMLELLISLSNILEFETSTPAVGWFWELLENLELNELNDRAQINVEKVNDILDRVIWRTYDYDGHGGLFPLVEPKEDQRKVEIWYQMSAYILERSFV